MICLLDATSIFEALLRRKLRLLSGNFTISLARYELGNVIWKRGALSGDINPERQAKLLALVSEGLKLMKVIDIGGQEGNVLEIAEELKITFYDAAYIHAAKTQGVPLVTEDRALRENAKKAVQAFSLEEID
ncbi:MAG: type II toxin-antitoxin system VapC family toxin [Candidatus Methanosuratincola sp.]